MKQVFVGFVLMACLSVAAPFAIGGEDASGALVTQVQGTAKQENKDGKGVPLKPFTKLQPGDRLTIATGAKLRMIYPASGRQEIWSDAARIEIGISETKILGQGTPPQVSNLPPYLVQTLTKSPEVIASIQNRQGMVRLRAISADKRIIQAWKQYDELRRATSDDDITPELHLLVALQELKAFSDIKEVLAEMLRRQPDNPEVKALNERYIGPAQKS